MQRYTIILAADDEEGGYTVVVGTALRTLDCALEIPEWDGSDPGPGPAEPDPVAGASSGI